LSVPLDRLADHYDAVVVGSGYGGAIAAARLAESGRRVCVLERGREYVAGSFPTTLWTGARQFQWRNGDRRHGSRSGLYDIHAGHDISVLVGCGLGGTSLINAGVALRAPDWVFDDARWPTALRHHGSSVLDTFYTRAEKMLGVGHYPEDGRRLPKLDALERVAAAVGGSFERVPVAVNFGPRPGRPDRDGTGSADIGAGGDAGPAGPDQHAEHVHAEDPATGQPICTLCGDCVAGCNYGAKNTVAVNYLPHAVAYGAQLFTETEVRSVLPSPLGGWTVSFDSRADGRRRFGGPSLFVRADVVVLAAGVMGSTDILFRSHAEGLAVSPRLGSSFSGNGDVLAFAYGTDEPVDGIGLGSALPDSQTAVGPCIAGMVRVAGDAGSTGERGIDIGDGIGLDDGGVAAAVEAAGAAAATAAGAESAGGVGTGGSAAAHADDILIEEGVVPGALRSVLPAALALAAETDGSGGPVSFLRRLRQRARAGAGLLLDPDRGPLHRTLTYLVMSDDRGDGRLVPEGDGMRVQWTGAGDHPVFDRDDRLLERASEALGAQLVRNPLSTPMLHDSLITVHPLGGCPMGDDASTGVVDHRSRVFTGDGDAVHDGLLVIDGAMVPRPLAVNPLLTISALAERSVELLVDDLDGPLDVGGTADAPGGSVIDGSPGGTGGSGGAGTGGRPGSPVLPTTRLAEPRAERPGLRFTERMRGYAGPAADGRPETGARRGRADGTPIEFVLTVGIPDLPALLDDTATPGTLAGTVMAPTLSDRRLRVVDGAFRLVQPDPTHVATWHMRYTMDLLAEDGRRFRFEGTKVLHDRPGLDAWGDTTTLYVTIVETTGIDPADSADPAAPDPAPAAEVADGRTVGEDGHIAIAVEGPAPRVVATGVMHLSPGDFARQMSTMRVTGVDSRSERLRWQARFDVRFLRSLLTVYGGPLDDVGQFPAAKAAPLPLTGDGHRRLRLPAPEPRWCDANGRWHEGNELGDDAWLRLVRYEGGRRGPVLLAPGFGMSATSFLVSTVETNLVEHLVAKGYDVWLFDYRAGIDLPSARSAFTMDVIAAEDWPAGVQEVLRVTGAPSVQVVAHCFGSATFMMALAAGLRGVRSGVCMQVTLHPVTSVLNQAKLSLKVGKMLGWVGMRQVQPFRGRTMLHTVLDQALRAVPLASDERCGKATCRWVNAIYGCTHRHAQLNDATHDLLGELFGVGDLTALDHIGKICQARACIADDGSNIYLEHPERLRVPLLLVHGERNTIFHPEGSLRTLRWLQENNDASLYDRVVIPEYAHLDCLIGRDASRDVFPSISTHLDRFNR
jgi:cholesterol oxidase